MTILYIMMLICCVPMVNGMDDVCHKKLLSGGQDLRVVLTQLGKTFSSESYEERDGASYKCKKTTGFVGNKDGQLYGNVILEGSSADFSRSITLEHYRLNKNGVLKHKSKSWNNFLALLPHRPAPFFNENDNFCFYGYSPSSDNVMTEPIIEYSLSKKGIGVTLHCEIAFDYLSDTENCHKEGFLASLGYIYEGDLLKAILASPSVIYNGMKVYPVTCITFPEHYEARIRHANIMFSPGSDFLFYAPEKIRQYIMQALFNQKVYNRLNKLAEATKVMERYFS